MQMNHETFINNVQLAAILANDQTKAMLVASLDLTPAQREERANDMERHAIHASGLDQEQRDLRVKLAQNLRLISAMDIAQIKSALVAEQE